MNELRLPSNYGLPHPTFRGGQHTAIEFCRNLTGTGIAEGETGSGKTSWAAATANGFKGEGRQKVTALVKTKNLQATNYGAGYNFDVLYGKGNYSCAHPSIPGGIKCDECLYHDEGMSNCPYSHVCPYIRQRNLVRYSNRVALNYAYWMYSKWPRDPHFSPDVLFCDEAHELSDFIINHVGITFTDHISHLMCYSVMRHMNCQTLL
jgi:Rad3-related DNA helicase